MGGWMIVYGWVSGWVGGLYLEEDVAVPHDWDHCTGGGVETCGADLWERWVGGWAGGEASSAHLLFALIGLMGGWVGGWMNEWVCDLYLFLRGWWVGGWVRGLPLSRSDPHRRERCRWPYLFVWERGGWVGGCLDGSIYKSMSGAVEEISGWVGGWETYLRS